MTSTCRPRPIRVVAGRPLSLTYSSSLPGTAVYARHNKFDLRREMATVIELSLRETLSEVRADSPAAAQLAA